MADFTPINSQEELDKVIAARISRERDTVTKQFQTQITERDTKIAGFESTISELTSKVESLTGQANRVKELEDKVAAYETSSVKMRIAREAGLPIELADRLSGSDEAAIRADAEALRKVFKGQDAPMYKPAENAGDGKDAALKNLLKNMRDQ